MYSFSHMVSTDGTMRWSYMIPVASVSESVLSSVPFTGFVYIPVLMRYLLSSMLAGYFNSILLMLLSPARLQLLTGYVHVQELLADLKNGLFGPYAGHVYTIEYQKRGLPH